MIVLRERVERERSEMERGWSNLKKRVETRKSANSREKSGLSRIL
mgnify:CR=1 FL=1